MKTRRQATSFAIAAALSITYVTLCLPISYAADDLGKIGVQLQTARKQGDCDRVQSVLEAQGKLIQLDEKNQMVDSDMNLMAAFRYDEKTISPPYGAADSGRSLRQYYQAAAEITIDDASYKPVLRADRGMIVSDVDRGKAMLYSPLGPLTSEELDLIDIQGNSLLIDSLLPGGIVKTGIDWDAPALVLSEILGLDTIAESDVKGRLVSVQDDVALIEMDGQIEGAADGASTEIGLKIKYQFNMKSRRINWFGMVVKEKRDVGSVGPGLELTARLQMQIAPSETPESLSEAKVRSLNLDRDAAITALSYRSPQEKWELAHGRMWYVTQDDERRAILRMIDRGEFVAQCNISSMPKVDVQKMGTLEQFRETVTQSLGENFGKVVEASQRANPSDYREYRLVIDGQSDGLPLRWIYYLLTDRDGNQAILAFVVEANLIERFASRDRAFSESFQLLDKTASSVGATPSTPTAR